MNSKDHNPFWKRNEIVLETEEDVDALKLRTTYTFSESDRRFLYRFDYTVAYSMGGQQYHVEGTLAEAFEKMKHTFKLFIQEGYAIRNPHLCLIGDNWLEEK